MTTNNTAIAAPPAILAVSNINPRCDAVNKQNITLK